MLKSYIPPKITTYAVLFFILLWLLNYNVLLIILLVLYLFIYILFRRNRHDFLDEHVVTTGVIFAPANGKILHIEPSVSHSVFGEQLIEIQIMISWWKEMGLYLPMSSEIKNLIVVKGQSFFRFQKADKVLGSKEGKGIHLKLDNKGESIGLSLFKCKIGLWPELIVMPGDRGSRRVNIGYFPFGGTVILYLPKKYEILLRENDEITAGESILAVNPDNK